MSDMSELNFTELPRRSVLSDDVYRVLRSSLLAREIPPGAKLHIGQLAAQLHVSNTPVRQALSRLVADGLVAQEPFRGFFASPVLDGSAVRDLYEFRLIVEPRLSALAAERAGTDDARRLGEICDQVESQRSSDALPTARMSEMDERFHGSIASTTGNVILVESLELVLARLPLHSMYSQAATVAQAWREHRAIADAIVASDPERAAEAMRVHLHNSYDRMRARISKLP